jgi:hypothetical protein
MAIENKFERCEPDDPLRCQAIVKTGQCPYKAVENGRNCPMHGGAKQQQLAQQEGIRNYRLAKWQSRVGEFADNDQVKSLREEIGILRVILEETLNMCKEPEELLIYSSKIADTVMKVEKLVASCHRLEASTGMLLDKTAALHLASVIVEIVSRYVTEPDAVDAISNEIVLAIAQARPEPK